MSEILSDRPPDSRPEPSRVVRVVVGLGNPGERYARTRHNAGFLVVERLRSDDGAGWGRRAERDEALVRIEDREVLLVRPSTFMNRSGRAVAAVAAEHGVTPEELLVVVDDVYLPPHRLRVRAQGSPGGHNGLLSIRECLGVDTFPRLRVGIGEPPTGIDRVEFVLEELSGGDWDELTRQVERAVEAVRLIGRSGLSAAMTRYNSAPSAGPGDAPGDPPTAPPDRAS